MKRSKPELLSQIIDAVNHATNLLHVEMKDGCIMNGDISQFLCKTMPNSDTKRK